MVGLVGPANHRDRRRRQVVTVRSGFVVLKRLMMRDVVAFGLAVCTGVRGAAHSLRRHGWIERRGRPEAALEKAPRDAVIIEQVPDVPPGHRDGLSSRA